MFFIITLRKETKQNSRAKGWSFYFPKKNKDFGRDSASSGVGKTNWCVPTKVVSEVETAAVGFPRNFAALSHRLPIRARIDGILGRILGNKLQGSIGRLSDL